MKRVKALLLLIATLSVLGVATGASPAHANTPPPWIVSLDANSTSNLDADPQSNNIVAKSFSVGAIINASSTHPLDGVFGWQFGIVYDNATLLPQGDPLTGSPSDASGPTIQFGAQPSLSWAGLITNGKAFGSFNIKSVDATHQKIIFFFTLISPTPLVNIAPALSATVKGNLLASVAFEIARKPTGPVSLSITDVELVDMNAHFFPNINPGTPVTVTITNDPPVASFTSTALLRGDLACSAVTGSPCSAYAEKFDASLSSDGDGSIANPTGYFWNFGDSTQDNVNVGSCTVLKCNQGSVAIHDFAVSGTFNVTLRVIDDMGATGTAWDSLGTVIVNNQPSHTFRTTTPGPPRSTATSVSCDSPVDVNQPSTCTVTVSDTSTSPTTPTGTATFTNSGSASGSFNLRTCVLSATSTTGAAACSANFTPSGYGDATISADYGGDLSHGTSSSTTVARISVRQSQGPDLVPVAYATIAVGAVALLTFLIIRRRRASR